MQAETEIKPPRNPVTLAINEVITKNAVDELFDQYLPAYDRITTSTYRDWEKNRAVGGTENSAHLHALAEDFVLTTKGTKNIITDEKAKKVFGEFIKSNWPGYSKFYPSGSSKNSHHVHVNLDRRVSTWTGWAGWAGLGVVGIFAGKRIFSNLKKGGIYGKSKHAGAG